MRTDWTQRWRAGLQRWRPASEGGFDPDAHEVTAIDQRVAGAFVRQHHYAGGWPSTSQQFGLFDHRGDSGRALVGVIALGTPMSQRVLTNPFPTLVPNAESLEWSRLILLDSVPGNGESWFSARALRLAATLGVREVVTFADPLPRWRRTDDGTLAEVKRGHIGGVYQGLNMTYLGRGAARTRIILPDATELTARAVSKLRRGERGSVGVVRRLVALGAEALEAGCAPAAWLTRELERIGAYRQRHPGNHRYVLRLGNRAQRTRTTIGLTPRRYPKPVLALELAAAAS